MKKVVVGNNADFNATCTNKAESVFESSYVDIVSGRRMTYCSKFHVENEDDAMAIAVRNSISDLNKVLHLNLAIQFYLFPFYNVYIICFRLFLRAEENELKIKPAKSGGAEETRSNWQILHSRWLQLQWKVSYIFLDRFMKPLEEKKPSVH